MNDSQLAAATHKDGPLLLIAAAGSGKTTVLTERTKNLLADGVPGDQILCCTFTKKAAQEMFTRIQKKTGQKVDVTTIHSLAFRMLRDEMKEKEIELITDTSWMVERALKLSKSKITTDDAESEISSLKCKLIHPHQATDPEMRLVYKHYEAIKEQKNAYDFNDLIIQAIGRLRTDKDFRKYWQKQWQYVMVDEFQDTNRGQWEMIRLIAQRHRNVFCVGDDYQTIFSFAGADPSIMMNFSREYAAARTIVMGTNYRSRETVLDVASEIIAMNPNQIHKYVVAHRKGGNKVRIIYVEDEEEEAKRIASTIKNEKTQNPDLKDSDFAVLYRTNTQSRPFEEALLESDIPCVVFGDRHFFELPSVSFLIQCMRLIESIREGVEPDTGLLTKIMRLWITRYETILLLQNEGMLFFEREEFAHIHETLQEWAEIEDPRELLDAIYAETPDGKQAESKQDSEPKLWLESLRKSASKFDLVSGFLRHIDRVLERSKDKKVDAVQLMTAHRSKGLEFHTVFIADMVEGFLPFKRALEENNVSEETRLAYVAVTRAKDDLYLMVPRHYGDNEVDPSRYIETVEHLCRKEQ